MSTFYSRVKWILQDVTKQSVSEWDGKIETEPFYVAIKDVITEWSAEAIMNKEKNEIMLLLKRDKYDKIDLPVFLHAYVRCRDQIWKSENKIDENHEYQTWGWKKFSSLENVFSNLLDKTDNSITFDFVINFKEEDEKLESLKYRCEQALMDNLCMRNALEMLETAIIYKESRLEEKCLSLIMLHYEDLKHTENWKSLKPPVAAKIIHALYSSFYVVRKNSLPESDADWDEDESSFISDLVHELGFNTSDDEDDDLNSVHDYFDGED